MDKFTATKVLTKRRFSDQERQMVQAINHRLTSIEHRLMSRKKAADSARSIEVRLSGIESRARDLCRKRGVSFDALVQDTRTGDAKALDAARKHLTGKAPRTADESNHLAALAAKYRDDDRRAREINEANSQRGIKGMLQKLLDGM